MKLILLKRNKNSRKFKKQYGHITISQSQWEP